MDSRFSAQELRARHKAIYHNYLKGRLDAAFNWGSAISVRQQVWQDDTSNGDTSVVCPVCWDIVRKEASDPNCPSCNGNGYVLQNSSGTITSDGFRDLFLTRAAISELSDEVSRDKEGYEFRPKMTMWVKYSEDRLRDGDLIAEVVPYDFGDLSPNPDDTTQYITNVVQKFVVISNTTPQWHPGNSIGEDFLAQRVSVSALDRSHKFWNVDMGESHYGGSAGYIGNRHD